MKTITIIIISLLGIYGIIVTIFYLVQDTLIFHPNKLPEDYEFDFSGRFREHFIKTHDGQKLNALHFYAPQPKGVILFFHGNAGSLVSWGDAAYPFIERNYHIFIWDYRGFGKSTGKVNYLKILKDSETVYNYIRQNFPDLQIIPYGRSFGTGPASYVTFKHNLDTVMLETSYNNFYDLARHHFKYMPHQLLLKYPFRNDKWLQKSNAKVYMVHGTEDEVVPLESAKKLKRKIGARAELQTIENGQHNNLIEFESYSKWLDYVLN